MATSYPTALDSFTDPTASDTMDGGTGGASVYHDVQHTNINDAIEAVQSQVGITGAFHFLLGTNNLVDVSDAGTSRFNLAIPSLSAVAAVAVANVTLSAPGGTLDGYTLLTNDEVLLTAQSTSSQNGVWTWNGASSALTRPHEYPSAGVVKRGRIILVANGTVYANTIWTLAATAAGLTIDTTAQSWVQAIHTAAPSAYALSTITADPNPGVKGTYYRANYAATANFTLPTSPITGSWIKIKNVSTTSTVDVVGTVDGGTSFTIPPLGSNELVYNGTNWDAN
jgi:hypothetical protein